MIRIGPAGNIASDIVSSIKRVKELGLSAQEVEFVRGVRMSNATAKKAGKVASELNVSLSVHAPYYINLASEEKEKARASIQRILMSCERGHHLGAKYIVFHAAYYGKRSKQETFDLVEEAINEMHDVIKAKKWKVVLAPEVTGKPSQFGDLDELLQLRKDVGCELCVDFAHLKARYNGKRDYDSIFSKLKKVKHLHCHFSGIEFTAKGERRHLVTPSSEIKELLKFVLKYKKDVTIINESPDLLNDSLKTLRILKSLK